MLNPGESCDDGNSRDADGCSAGCAVEPGWYCHDPVLAGSSNAVADGGFEAGSPNPAWSEFSARFGTPLCTVPDCGFGGGSGPAAGASWAWFGGTLDFETGMMGHGLKFTSPQAKSSCGCGASVQF